MALEDELDAVALTTSLIRGLFDEIVLSRSPREDDRLNSRYQAITPFFSAVHSGGGIAFRTKR